MPDLDLQYDLVNGQPASATPVDANLKRTETFINGELINRDGTVAMTAPLRLFGNPVNDLDAASKAYVDSVIPIGIIMMYGGAAVPGGGKWALCNGAELETNSYQALFNIIGNNYTTAPVAGRFNVPDLSSRVPVGPTLAEPPLAMGAHGGSRVATLPTHTHAIDHTHGGVVSDNETGWHTHAGADHAHPVAGYTSGMTANHVHDIGELLRYNPYAPVRYLATTGGSGFPNDTRHASEVATGTDHQHHFSGGTGGADRALTTGNQQAFHVHSVNIPALVGASGAAGVTAGVDSNMPPYVVVQYVIRVS